MGFFSRLFGRDEGIVPVEKATTGIDALLWGDGTWSTDSVTGISINQQTALNATGVLAAVTMLSEDVAKLPWSIFGKDASDGSPTEAKGHYLYDLLDQPNEWQNGLEFREQMQVGLILRGNAYAAIVRNMRGIPIRLVPINPDWVALWETQDGSLFYKISPQGLHMQAMLRGLPDLIPAEDMFHLRGFSSNGLLGASRIRTAREAIALSLAQEQTMARWMGNGARPSGMLTTDQKLSTEAANRIKADVKDNWVGLQNSGKMIIGEQGLKFSTFAMTAADLEFIASRQFQLEEVGRIFRIPAHMLGHLIRSTNNNIAQQAQEYINYTLTGYTNRWKAKMAQTFGLRKAGLTIEFDYRALTQADITSRINDWRTAVMSMIATPDEARIDLGMKPKGGPAAELQQPSNMAQAGSQSTGTQPDGGGRPPADAPTDLPPQKYLNGHGRGNGHAKEDH